MNLPAGIESQLVENINGLSMHFLTAGKPCDPCIVLLHGFPDLAFGWRHVMPLLANAGYYVIAPDQRGYGATTGWSDEYHTDLRPFGMQNLVKDLVSLLAALKIRNVHCLVGHDFGSPVAAYAALLREDLISRLICMSAPFPGSPGLSAKSVDLDVGLKSLQPPRKHYQSYYSTEAANRDMLECTEGLTAFLRAYFHVKSADWSLNDPKELKDWSAESLSGMPGYYIMPQHQTMPGVVAPFLPDSICSWLTDAELATYATEFSRTGFQGGLNWYRTSGSSKFRSELSILSAKRIRTPAWYVAGRADWGTYQSPGALKRMATSACNDFRGEEHIPDAGHWVQQEQPKLTADVILRSCASS